MSERKNSKLTLVLASNSPRRKELLGHTGISFGIRTSNISEETNLTNPIEIVKKIAEKKGRAVYDSMSKEEKESSLIISADTIGELEGEILLKPVDIDSARVMLQSMSGKTHKILTAVHYITSNKVKTIVVTSEVTFGNIDKDLLELYLKSKDSLDKSGSYGVQGQSQIFIESINGSYSNIVGFPLHEFIQALKEFLGATEDGNGAWRQAFK
jgi:septum formation protein